MYSSVVSSLIKYHKSFSLFVGAFGYFEVTHDITRYTKAAVFSQIGKKTKIACRFSTVLGERGSADLSGLVRLVTVGNKALK